MTGFFKSFVYFTLHLFFLFSMVQQYLLNVFLDVLPFPQHQFITIINSFPAYAHSHSVLIKYIIHISADSLSIFSSFTLPCCFDPEAVLTCDVACNSHLYIPVNIFYTLQRSSSVLSLRYSLSSLACLACISLLRRASLISLSRSSTCLWL